MKRTIQLDREGAWTLTAEHDGERYTLHVTHSDGASASLSATVYESEMFDFKRHQMAPITKSAQRIFEIWNEQYDQLISIAEASQ